MIENTSFDRQGDRVRILIVGAGPAGISTALFLAKKGIRCTLIEKETFPRDKICGDGVTPWAVTMLHKLDMGLVEEIRESKHSMGWSGGQLMAANQTVLEIKNFYHKRPGEPPGYTIRRKEFDQILINKVKQQKLIELVEGMTITGFNYTENGVSLTTNQEGKTFEGDLVVWSNGAKSEFSKEQGGMPAGHEHWITCIKTYYSGLYPDYSEETRRNFKENALELICVNDTLPGYLWIFPMANGEANVGLGMRTKELKKRRINLKQTLDKFIQETPGFKERFAAAERIAPIEAWPIPIGVKKRSISGNRYLITGDAASLGDPASGEGIGNSLNSGFHAAEHIADCLEKGRFDAEFNKKYDQRVYKKLWNELRISKILLWITLHPRILNWTIRKMRKKEHLLYEFLEQSESPRGKKRMSLPGVILKLIFK